METVKFRALTELAAMDIEHAFGQSGIKCRRAGKSVISEPVDDEVVNSSSHLISHGEIVTSWDEKFLWGDV